MIINDHNEYMKHMLDVLFPELAEVNVIKEFKLDNGAITSLQFNAMMPVAVTKSPEGEAERLILAYPTHNNGGYKLCTRTHTYQEVVDFLNSLG